jgi:hypothetical protein
MTASARRGRPRKLAAPEVQQDFRQDEVRNQEVAGSKTKTKSSEHKRREVLHRHDVSVSRTTVWRERKRQKEALLGQTPSKTGESNGLDGQ